MIQNTSQLEYKQINNNFKDIQQIFFTINITIKLKLELYHNSLKKLMISPMKKTPITRSISVSSRTHNQGKKNEKISPPEVAEAYAKFNTLNSQYHVQTNYQLLRILDNNQSPLHKAKQKINNFTIMTKLRHLQNLAEISKVDQEMQKRRNRQHRSSSVKWAKRRSRVQKTFDQPYLITYKNFLKEIIQKGMLLKDDFSQQSESEEYPNQPSADLLEKLKYGSSLRPYKSFLLFTEQKISEKEKKAYESSAEFFKSENISKFEEEKNPKLSKQYQKVMNKMIKNEINRKDAREEGKKIMEKNLRKKFRQKLENEEGDQIVHSERFSKLRDSQSNILRQNKQMPSNSLTKVRRKFTGLMKELCIAEEKSIKKLRPQSVPVRKQATLNVYSC